MSNTTARPPAAFVISITPFDRDGHIDEAGFRGHLRRLAAAGIGVYIGGSGSGEGYTLTPAETRRLLDIGVEELKGKVPVRAMGVEPRTPRQMVEFLALCKAAGVDAAQIYSLDVGHGHPPLQEEVASYLTEALESTDLPVVISTHQSVGYRVPVETISRLLETYPHIIEVNCSHQDLRYLADIVDATRGRVGVFVGGPVQALVGWALGGQGYLCSEGNLAPHLCMSLVRAYAANDLEGVMRAYGKIVRLHGLIYANGGIRATKGALIDLGLPGG